METTLILLSLDQGLRPSARHSSVALERRLLMVVPHSREPSQRCPPQSFMDNRTCTEAPMWTQYLDRKVALVVEHVLNM